MSERIVFIHVSLSNVLVTICFGKELSSYEKMLYTGSLVLDFYDVLTGRKWTKFSVILFLRIWINDILDQ
jgi:hypothetical protein